jgi:hypothetical protein
MRDRERELFEEVHEHLFSLKRNEFGGYADNDANNAWLGWKARAMVAAKPGVRAVSDAAVDRIINKVDRENSVDGMDGDSWDRLLVRAALESVEPLIDTEGKKDWDELARILGADGDNVDQVFRVARSVMEKPTQASVPVGEMKKLSDQWRSDPHLAWGFKYGNLLDAFIAERDKGNGDG